MPVGLGSFTESDYSMRQALRPQCLDTNTMQQKLDSRRSGPLDLHSRSGTEDGLSLINYLTNEKYVM